jgi:hypothetical protein
MQGVRDWTDAGVKRSRAAVTLRIGVPTTGGELLEAILGSGQPLLISAGAMWDNTRKQFRPPSDVLLGADVALDSAGFVAMKLHGGYPWSVSQYVEGCVLTRFRDRSHAGSPVTAPFFPWAWWSQMDLCCEPEIAGNRQMVRARVQGTASLLQECRDVCHYYWEEEGWNHDWLPYPMPILQGWESGDYELSADLLDKVVKGRWPDLVGLGSVCRRNVQGPNGVLQLLAHLDRILPSTTKLHLFGVKGAALSEISKHYADRVASVDSMAWEMAARMEARKTGERKTVGYRVDHLKAWMDRNLDRSDAPQQVLQFSQQGVDISTVQRGLYGSMPDQLLYHIEKTGMDTRIDDILYQLFPQYKARIRA